MATNYAKKKQNTSMKDMLQKPDLTTRVQGDEPLPPGQLLEMPTDTQTPATKEDKHLLLADFHKAINALHQDFKRTLSDLDKSVRELDSHLTTVESTSADQVLENIDRTTLIEKLEKNYDLLHDKLGDRENRSRCNNIHVRTISAAVSTSDLEAHIWALFGNLLGPDCDQPVLSDRTHRVIFSLSAAEKPPSRCSHQGLLLPHQREDNASSQTSRTNSLHG
ncbi:hypothetical protein NDU88_003703 [Pleurodeles waltl]|uniref:Uncharacterized protein n=1 Tax=Pleurodeles waltl TaxID=8319 RepID=A0AAV7REN8_PLEWA|nr:hypothetical protein NDU88_003703 [Pleurodeles waltl]